MFHLSESERMILLDTCATNWNSLLRYTRPYRRGLSFLPPSWLRVGGAVVGRMQMKRTSFPDRPVARTDVGEARQLRTGHTSFHCSRPSLSQPPDSCFSLFWWVYNFMSESWTRILTLASLSVLSSRTLTQWPESENYTEVNLKYQCNDSLSPPPPEVLSVQEVSNQT